MPSAMSSGRCPSALRLRDLATRCYRPQGHGGDHVGHGLRELPYQHIVWRPDDRRSFLSRNPERYAWAEGEAPAHPGPA